MGLDAQANVRLAWGAAIIVGIPPPWLKGNRTLLKEAGPTQIGITPLHRRLPGAGRPLADHASAGGTARGSASVSVAIVVFALVTHGTHHDFVAHDLEEDDIARCTKRNHQLA